jgi:polysaccharide deacetylase 2 family uncharacterized protein YibQ
MAVGGWRALGLFWAAVIAALAGLGGTLAWLGPPAEPVVAEAPAVPASPIPAPSPPQAAAPPPREAPTPAAVGAPEPPPLPAAEARRDAAQPVIARPDPALLEPGRHGPLPRLAAENRSSIRAYARPFDRQDPRPKAVVIINNMGLFAQHSEEAIRRLPGGVTLAFSPYAPRPERLLEQARARGMELLVALPLEPQGYGQLADPGDRALLTSLSREENLDRLDWALSRLQGQVGAIGGLGGMRGERFAANPGLLGSVQDVLTRRGLLYVDPRPGAPQPARAFGRSVDVLLDEPSAVRAEVERKLAELEALAQRNGSAVGLANDPVPSVVAAIAAWGAGLEARGLVVAPVTAVIRRPTEQASR